MFKLIVEGQLYVDILSNEKYSVESCSCHHELFMGRANIILKFGFVYPIREDIQMANGQFEPLCSITKIPINVVNRWDSKIHPTSIYGITKSNQEQMVHVVCKSLGISSIALRYQNVYGQDNHLVILTLEFYLFSQPNFK